MGTVLRKWAQPCFFFWINLSHFAVVCNRGLGKFRGQGSVAVVQVG